MKHDARPLRTAFLLVASLFFIWGFCHAMLDVLNKHFQDLLQVSKAQSGFVQTAVFGAYFVMAFPAALLMRRIGYQRGILTGLLVLALGAFLFIPAGLWLKNFGGFLIALFVLSCGLACIETGANPYITTLGPKEGAAARLSTAQAFNSVAYIIAPTVGGAFIFGRHSSEGQVDFHTLIIPYTILGCFVLVVFAVFYRIKLPEVEAGRTSADSNAQAATAPIILHQQPHFCWGLATQFLYIAAQVGVNAFAVNYILENAIVATGQGEIETSPWFERYRHLTGAASPEATSAYVVTIAMVLYAIGRFSAGLLTRRIPPNLLLAIYGCLSSAVIIVVMADIKHVSWMVLPLCWLFMSVMFPFIFAMSLANLGPRTQIAASFQIMAIVGGAIAPPLMGWLADTFHNMAICFGLPLIGFIATAIYGIAYPRLLARSEGRSQRLGPSNS